MSLELITQFVIDGEEDDVVEQVQKLLDAGVEPMTIITDGLTEGMNQVGDLFKEGEMFVPEVLASAQAMSKGIELVKPLVLGEGSESAGTVIIGTVMGDLHDLGKNLVGMMMESNGFEVINLGTDVSPEQFVQAAIDHNAQVVGMSALLTTTMKNMEATIIKLEEAGLKGKVKVMVGGAPVTKAFSEKIGADSYSADAIGAVEVLKTLVN